MESTEARISPVSLAYEPDPPMTIPLRGRVPVSLLEEQGSEHLLKLPLISLASLGDDMLGDPFRP